MSGKSEKTGSIARGSLLVHNLCPVLGKCAIIKKISACPAGTRTEQEKGANGSHDTAL